MPEQVFKLQHLYPRSETVVNEETRKGVNMDPVASFFRVYANLPLNEREQVIIVLDDQSISWEVARNELIHKTERGKKIIEKLIALKII